MTDPFADAPLSPKISKQKNTLLPSHELFDTENEIVLPGPAVPHWSTLPPKKIPSHSSKLRTNSMPLQMEKSVGLASPNIARSNITPLTNSIDMDELFEDLKSMGIGNLSKPVVETERELDALFGKTAPTQAVDPSPPSPKEPTLSNLSNSEASLDSIIVSQLQTPSNQPTSSVCTNLFDDD